MSDAPTISLTGINLYPVKGAAGLSLQRCTLDSFGIVHDRRWMVVDSDGKVYFGREPLQKQTKGVKGRGGVGRMTPQTCTR